MTTPTTHEACFALAPPPVRERLVQIQTVVLAQVPSAVACVSYRMPAFRQARIFFYFGAFKRHIGVYPPLTQNEALIEEMRGYRGPKGNLTFLHEQALPLDMLGRLAKALSRQYGSGQ